MSTIELTNVGPIAGLSLEVPAGGGLIEFLGPHGVGKSHALAAIDAAVSGKPKPPVHDGAALATVNAFGAVMSIGRQAHRDTAALCVNPIEGKFSIADLIDPGLKNAAAADAARIKAILQITGQKPDASLFYDLVGGKEEFEQAVKATTLQETEDLVRMAEAVKRDFEAAARTAEDNAIKAEERAKVTGAASAGVDLKAESDPAKLSKAYGEAVRAEQALQTKRSLAMRAAQGIALAEAQIEEAAANYQGPTVGQAIEREKQEESLASAAIEAFSREDSRFQQIAKAAKEHFAVGKKAIDKAKQAADAFAMLGESIAAVAAGDGTWADVRKATEAVRLAEHDISRAVEVAAEIRRTHEELLSAESSLATVRERRDAASVALSTAIRERKAAEAHESALASYRKAVEAVAPQSPSPEELATASEAVKEAREASELGVLIRQALENRRVAEAAVKEASANRIREKHLRAAAQGVERVLSEAVSRVGGPLFVEGGRLKIQTDRGAECYAELSDGERCLVAVRIAVRAVGPNGLVVLPQRFNQELNSADRAAIHADACEVKAYVVTARITEDTNGELRAEPFQTA